MTVRYFLVTYAALRNGSYSSYDDIPTMIKACLPQFSSWSDSLLDPPLLPCPNEIVLAFVEM